MELANEHTYKLQVKENLDFLKPTFYQLLIADPVDPSDPVDVQATSEASPLRHGASKTFLKAAFVRPQVLRASLLYHTAISESFRKLDFTIVEGVLYHTTFPVPKFA